MSTILKHFFFRRYSSAPTLPKCDFVAEKYAGPSLEELHEIRRTRLSPVMTTYHRQPVAFHQGHKQWLFDLKGKRYLDMFAGICTVSVGHSHPKINAAVNAQMQKLGHVSNVYFHSKIHEYAKRLTDKLPGNLKVAYFVNSGSEANDLAVLLARAYTNKSEIVTLKNCYHGMTYQTMSLTSNQNYKYTVPQAPDVHNIMNPDVYRGIWGGSKCRDSPVQTLRTCLCSGSCNAKTKYIEQLQDVFNYNLRKGNLAAFFAESIQGVGGIVQYPKGYLKDAHAVVKENGGLLVIDEVQTGFGRTGEHFWGFQMHDLEPDIVTMAKGMGNGYPLAAVITTPEIAQALTKATHFNTFGGNPIGCTVGIAVLDIIEEEKLQQNSHVLGTYFLKELEKLKSRFPVIGDVRGKGLMIGIELEENDGKPLQADKLYDIWDECRDLGLLVGRGGVFGNVLRVQPPMCITKEDVDFSVQVLETAFEKYMNKLNNL